MSLQDYSLLVLNFEKSYKRKMNKYILTSIFISHALFLTNAYSHSGRLNSEGCHNDRKGGTGYHCHRKQPPAPPVVPVIPVIPVIPVTPPIPPEPEPEPIVVFPVTNKSAEVLRGSAPEMQSIYNNQIANLPCVQTNKGAYDASLELTPDGFCIASSEEKQQCDSYSSRFSFLTNILTIFKIDVGKIIHKAGLEMNEKGCFDPVYVRDETSSQSNTSEYDRNQWGDWIDEDGDCSDTRSEVLKSFNKAQIDLGRTCILSVGLWYDPYSGGTFTNPSELDIDHIVPLSFAHKHGAENWSPELKAKFYNDMENLLPVSSEQNRSKGDKSPTEWMPDNAGYHCTYVDSFLYIVDKYHLDLTELERSDIKNQC